VRAKPHWESMLLTNPGRCHLREEATEPCLKVGLLRLGATFD
jgi:hypothetical protein